MSREFSVAVVGATGAVGNEILRVLEERQFPVKELRLLASERSEGTFLEFRGEEIVVEALGNDSFGGIDLALFSAGGELSQEYCPVAAAAGAVCVDNSSAWRMDPEVPLVVPEVNPGEIARFRNKGIVANPNCSTIQMVLPLKALHDFSPVKRVVVSTYQAVSGSGQKAVDELRIQSGELLNGRPIECKVYPHQIGFNCLPQIDAFLDNGYTKEEMKMVNETRKILGDDGIRVTATAVRVPVFYGHSESVNVETTGKITAVKARELFAAFPSLEVLDDAAKGVYPMPVASAGEDLTYVGRIREDESVDNGLNLWVVADNVRKGAATNAVQIAEILAEKYL
ncbi:MAG: aspartate-semialdehyde dehydrogenase [Desulfuromonas sp.]|uniref:aspartate-semialdehyde dehydrogenase n=1 Tax=Desulfuromonas sp. TaxID=892 RepID=UPI000CAD5127|nr:aspartate-semialdehyde dehydrogenase [Desulfuromonas sp.]PLX85108.1 MAG: aspartate-semialdehyde dehydrogenase [Desulfuromonas sp.]